MRPVVSPNREAFLKLGDTLLGELKPKKLPKPETDAFRPYYPKPKKSPSRYYKRNLKKMKKGVYHR